MINKQIQLEEEKAPKKQNRHPKISLIFTILGVVFAIVALVFGILKDLEKLYTSLSVGSLILMLLSFNMSLKFKGFYSIFYPIIMIYALGSSFIFDNNLLKFQFSILAVVISFIYFIQNLYDTIKSKKNIKIIFPTIVLAIAIIACSLQFVLDLYYVNIIALSLLAAVNVYELILNIFYFKTECKMAELEKNEEEKTKEK